MTSKPIATSLVQDTLATIDNFRAQQAGPNFAIIYGSYASGTSSRFSDIDIMFLCKKKPANINPFVNFVTELHSYFSHEIDEEVPFSNKLVVSYEEACTATTLKQFSVAGNEVTIPPIEKETEFLRSKDIRYRLIFNALTSPNIFIGGDAETYRQVRTKSSQALALLATSLCRKKVFSAKDLITSLLYGKNGEEGELYLGYKNNQQSMNALWSNLGQGLSFLCQKKILSKQHDIKYKRTPAFSKAISQHLSLSKT